MRNETSAHTLRVCVSCSYIACICVRLRACRIVCVFCAPSRQSASVALTFGGENFGPLSDP